MGLVINTNISSMVVQNNLTETNNAISQSLKRLSSGLRINSAKDDAAGFAIANSFASKISAMRVASQNATEAQSMLQTADGAYSKINDILVRMKSLATQAASGQTDVSTMGDEFTSLQEEIDRIAASTKYGSTTLIQSDTDVTFQVGASSDDQDRITVSFLGANADTLGVSSGTINISDATNALAAMDAIDDALTSINLCMSNIGSFQNRLQYTIDNLSTSIENYSASESAIRDVDMAAEMSTFTKNQILQQAGMAMLAQANAAPQQILTLLS